MWFEKLTGFVEEHGDQVRSSLILDGDTLTSKANGRSMRCGRLETPDLGGLRARAAGRELPEGTIRVEEVLADVSDLHLDPANAGAVFQVASQFNLLEMVAPTISPEAGVGIYEQDRTQGPACAIACGAGTIYRNYFVPVHGRIGQTGRFQIDCLADLGKALDNDSLGLWTMRNGYALPTGDGLRLISGILFVQDEDERDELRQLLRVGIQAGTEVTLRDAGHRVTQVYCSALPVAYGTHAAAEWESFARLVLEAAYEATFLAALLNLAETGDRRLYLTWLGGGAFGNDDLWIRDAIRRAIERYAHHPLEVSIVSFGGSRTMAQDLTLR